jgi:HK97 family phage major capsid protein
MQVKLVTSFDRHPAGSIIEMPNEDAAFGIAKGLCRPLTDEEEATKNDLARIKATQQAIHKLSPKQPIDHGRSFPGFLKAVAARDSVLLKALYNSDLVVPETKTALGTGAAGSAGAGAGGYAIPQDFATNLRAVAAELAIMRPGAFVTPMNSPSLKIPYPDTRIVQAAGTSPFFGGALMSWIEDNTTLPETEPGLRQLELQAHLLSGYAVFSNPMLDDAGDAGAALLLEVFGQAIAWYEDYAFLQGNGVGKPLGVLNAPASYSLTRNLANTIQYTDIVGMHAHLIPASWNRACWVFAVSALPALLQLKDGASRAVLVQAGAGSPSPTWTIMGRPAYPTEKLPALGTKGDLLLIDRSLYAIGQRSPILIAASQHPKFLQNQSVWRLTELVDGQPWFDSTITLQDGTTVASPFVVLN